MAKTLMIQGTGSGVGKSLITAGLCRLFRNRGIDVAPFKAQNMALNSFITKEGGEIGRAQALQAEAARVEPSVDMNPVLLKATSDAACQVIIHGRVHADMNARAYYSFKDEAWKAVTESYGRLSKRHELIVIEGAGSPAEINLANDEIVNMSIARHAGARVILVGDIDKGGVFASLFGTIGLLDGDAARIKAFIINKFRGDRAILDPGLAMIREKTGRPVIGVIPYLGDPGLHEEDAIPLERYSFRVKRGGPDTVKIVVLGLRSISNFTDFDPFLCEPDTELVYSLRAEDIEGSDMVILPGSKNTVSDLLFLKEQGTAESVKRAATRGVPVIGICGGYQMLGKRLFDPNGIESRHEVVDGLGLLDVETVFEEPKVTAQVEARVMRNAPHPTLSGRGQSKSGGVLRGYEIHMGRTIGDIGLFMISRLNWTDAVLDGSAKGSVWGTYIHGIFDNDRFRRDVINAARARRGWTPLEETIDYTAVRDGAIEKWANELERHVDMRAVEHLVDGALP